MKTIEQKAKRYDEVIKLARFKIKYGKDHVLHGKDIYDILPELKESEDERIRKELIDFVRTRLVGFPQCEKFIAWIEKQGQVKESDVRHKYLEELLIADNIYQMSMNEAMAEEAKSKAVNALSKLEISKLLCFEKQDEQKPDDKIGPRFKIGDWVIHNDNKHIPLKIIEKIGMAYRIVDTVNYHHTILIDYINKNYHLWVIKNAKDGDVLVNDKGRPFIFKGLLDPKHPGCPVAYGGVFIDCYDVEKFCISERCNWWCDSIGVKPATEEQRDLLFAKMKKAGYKFDFVKKEFKKIEQKSSEGIQNRAKDNVAELRQSEDEKIRKSIDVVKCLINGMKFYYEGNEEATWGTEKFSMKVKDILVWLEKQGKKEQLYIRFGEIPTDEKSKIYHGEIEVGTENGVSVYPAFKTDEGNIVLGLNLPITKTTLYTQQHLIEYDDRPCYLVKGDYVGKDTDGQPLIKNVSIIEKIDSYRIKEEKQGKQKPADKAGPKFHVGEWITNGDYTWKILEATPLDYILQSQDGNTVGDTISHVDEQFHSFTIKDAKNGDILVNNEGKPFIFKETKPSNIKTDVPNPLTVLGYCGIGGAGFTKSAGWGDTVNRTYYPATKEQRDILMKAMTDAGYTFENKELKRIE